MESQSTVTVTSLEVLTKTYTSSTIKQSQFAPSTGKLRIEFNNASVYDFENVTISDYLLFSDADSVGKAFNQYIRQYNGTKIG